MHWIFQQRMYPGKMYRALKKVQQQIPDKLQLQAMTALNRTGMQLFKHQSYGVCHSSLLRQRSTLAGHGIHPLLIPSVIMLWCFRDHLMTASWRHRVHRWQMNRDGFCVCTPGGAAVINPAHIIYRSSCFITQPLKTRHWLLSITTTREVLLAALLSSLQRIYTCKPFG